MFFFFIPNYNSRNLYNIHLLEEQPERDVLYDLVRDVLWEKLELEHELEAGVLLDALLDDLLLVPEPRALVVQVNVVEAEVPSLEFSLICERAMLVTKPKASRTYE